MDKFRVGQRVRVAKAYNAGRVGEIVTIDRAREDDVATRADGTIARGLLYRVLHAGGNVSFSFEDQLEIPDADGFEKFMDRVLKPVQFTPIETGEWA